MLAGSNERHRTGRIGWLFGTVVGGRANRGPARLGALNKRSSRERHHAAAAAQVSFCLARRLVAKFRAGSFFRLNCLPSYAANERSDCVLK
jgi:hypothetical protein